MSERKQLSVVSGLPFLLRTSKRDKPLQPWAFLQNGGCDVTPSNIGAHFGTRNHYLSWSFGLLAHCYFRQTQF
jgi:hypothetical protein